MSKTEEIGNRVKNLMDLNNITQRELAAKIKISEPAISYLINGKRMPRLETITAIAEALNTDLATILGNNNLYKSDFDCKITILVWYVQIFLQKNAKKMIVFYQKLQKDGFIGCLHT